MLKKLRECSQRPLHRSGYGQYLIYVRDKGIVLDEPSVVAIRIHNGQKTIEAVGMEAKRMLGRTPGNITAIRPSRRRYRRFPGYRENAAAFHSQGARESLSGPSPGCWSACPACPPRSSAARSASPPSVRAQEVRLIEEPMAAAIGAGSVSRRTGCMVVDVGRHHRDSDYLLNGVVYRDSLRIGGDRFDEAIVAHVRRRYGSLIGDATAERIKEEIGCAFAGSELREIDVRGRNLAEGYPQPPSTATKYESLQDPLSSIAQAVKSAGTILAGAGGDIAESGIALTGGGALARPGPADLRGDRLAGDCGEDPLTCCRPAAAWPWSGWIDTRWTCCQRSDCSAAQSPHPWRADEEH